MPKDYSKPAPDNSLWKVTAALTNNGFNVRIVDDLREARQAVLDIIPLASEVFTATSVTLDEAMLTEDLNSLNYISVRDGITGLGKSDALERRRYGSGSEYTVGSVHAITEDGQVVIASASGSQLPNYAYGAEKVIWVVGSQKIVKDLNEAFDRIEQHTLPLEDERAKKAYGVGSVISKLIIYKSDPQKRVTIVLVKEAVGY